MSNLEGGILKIGESSWVITLEEDPETGELILPIPQEALDAQGWGEGDILVWTHENDGSIVLTKKDENT
jgi:bifunctional DNA-binding transcriptional regulator/antitoxin component of YhaV-PrlF toxin-antitoxin module